MLFNSPFIHDIFIGIFIWYIVLPMSIAVLFAFLTLFYLWMKRRLTEVPRKVVKKDEKKK